MLTRHPDLEKPSAPPPPETFPRSPRQRWATVAAFVCPETERLGREAGFPVAVLAATADPELHAAWLSSTRYAAWSPRSYDSWPLPFDDGLATPRDLAYRQLRFDRRWLGATGLPHDVSLDRGGLTVALPEGTALCDLASVLRAGLADLAFDRVARRPDRVRHRYATGRPVVVAPRYSLLTPGDVERVTVAEDLFHFGPGDLADVARALALSVGSLAVVAAAGRLRSGHATEVSRG